MEITVFIETLEDGRFRARTRAPIVAVVEDRTREAVLQTLAAQLPTDARIISVDLPSANRPLARFAGMLKDDPLFEEWQASIAEYRREVDEDPSYL